MRLKGQHQSASVNTRWEGRIYLWTGRALYLGPFYTTDFHTHHAVQCTLALQNHFYLRLALSQTLRPMRAAIIPSNQPHQVVAGGELTGALFLDPESEDAWRLTSNLEVNVKGLEAVRSSFNDCWQDALPIRDVEQAIKGWLDVLLLPATKVQSRDIRVLEAITLLNKMLGHHTLSVAELATRVGLSQSRLSHLFRSHTGLPVRRYVLWLRLQEAVRIIADGHSLTEAAYAAGFADSAHLTRTFHSMFGLAPSVIASSQFVQASQ